MLHLGTFVGGKCSEEFWLVYNKDSNKEQSI